MMQEAEPLYVHAVKQARLVSMVSKKYLMRYFKIEEPRAVAMIDRMHAEGIIEPGTPGKWRVLPIAVKGKK